MTTRNILAEVFEHERALRRAEKMAGAARSAVFRELRSIGLIPDDVSPSQVAYSDAAWRELDGRALVDGDAGMPLRVVGRSAELGAAVARSASGYNLHAMEPIEARTVVLSLVAEKSR